MVTVVGLRGSVTSSGQAEAASSLCEGESTANVPPDSVYPRPLSTYYTLVA